MGNRMISVDPMTGESLTLDQTATSSEQVLKVCSLAAEAHSWWEAQSLGARALALRSIADAVSRNRNALVRVAMRETGLSSSRLESEASRAENQFRFFADTIDDGAFLEIVIDHAVEVDGVRLPELRRMLVPLGTVAVFGSSNFPFAFSVLGGDTASALAAGNAVVVKAHSSHPQTCAVSIDVLHEGLAAVGAPSDVASIVYGQEAGVSLVTDSRIKAVGFTGSLGAAQSLITHMERRAEPVPFYGELSSLNPLVVLKAALVSRATRIADGLAAAVLESSGQLCTKPGVVFLPRGPEGDQFVEVLASRFSRSEPRVLLNERVQTHFESARDSMMAHGRNLTPGDANTETPEGFFVRPALLSADLEGYPVEELEEAFGPLVVVLRYDDTAQILATAPRLPGSLTFTVHGEDSDMPTMGQLIDAFKGRTGRIIVNGFPTGVRVSSAQHHGGPWPATNSIHTSVGATALRRFLRPMAWQDAPSDLLPEPLREEFRGVARRIDGQLLLA